MKKPTSKDTRLPLPPGYTFNTPAEMYYEYILESKELREAVFKALFLDSKIVEIDPLGVHDCKEFWPKTIPLTIYESSGTTCPISDISGARPCDIDASAIDGVKDYNPFAKVTTLPGMLVCRLKWLAEPLAHHKHFVDLSDQQRVQLDRYFHEGFTVKMSRYVMRDKFLQITFFRPPDVDGGIPVCLWINPCKKKEEIRAEFEKLLNTYDQIRQGTGLATADKSVLQGFEGKIPCEMDDPKKSHYTRISDKIPSAQKALSALRFWRIKKQLDDLHEKDPEKVLDLQGLPKDSITSFTVNRGYRDAEGVFTYLKSGIVQFMPKSEGDSPAQ